MKISERGGKVKIRWEYVFYLTYNRQGIKKYSQNAYFGKMRLNSIYLFIVNIFDVKFITEIYG